MDVRTYRARSIQEALRLIRDDLGPDAAVLHTREVNAGMLGGIFGGRQIEVTASTEVQVPSRLPLSASPKRERREAQPFLETPVAHAQGSQKPPVAHAQGSLKQGSQNEF